MYWGAKIKQRKNLSCQGGVKWLITSTIGIENPPKVRRITFTKSKVKVTMVARKSSACGTVLPLEMSKIYRENLQRLTFI